MEELRAYWGQAGLYRHVGHVLPPRLVTGVQCIMSYFHAVLSMYTYKHFVKNEFHVIL